MSVEWIAPWENPDASDAAELSAVHAFAFTLVWALVVRLAFLAPSVFVIAPVSAYVVTRLVWRGVIAPREELSTAATTIVGLLTGVAIHVTIATLTGIAYILRGVVFMTPSSADLEIIPIFLVYGVYYTLGIPIVTTAILVTWLVGRREKTDEREQAEQTKQTDDGTASE